MSGPKRAVPTQKGRYYTDPKDVLKRYVSVTNVIDTINKPALVGWAARTVAEQAVNDLVLVTKMSRTSKDEAIAYLKGTPYAAKDAAADLGTRLHKLAEAHELGHDLPPMEPDEQAMFSQYMAYRHDWEPTYEATEATVCNRSLGYAGTLDGLLRFQPCPLPRAGSALVVGDYKTGKTGPYAEWGLQLAAYAGAEALWLPDDSEIPMPTVAGGVVIRVRPDFYGIYELDPAAMPVLLEVFTHLIHVTRWLHNDTQQRCFSDLLIPQRTTVAEVA